jgi:hypothetical protein
MKYKLILLLLLGVNLDISSQVISLRRLNYERVNFSNSEDTIEKRYYQTIAFIINDYVKIYYGKDKLNVIVNIWNTPYDVRIQDKTQSLISQLVNETKELDYGIFANLPDSCLSLYKTINLIDLGFSSEDSTLNCLKRYVINPKGFYSSDCFPSDELIESAINKELDANKIRYLKRMKRKYALEDINCIDIESFRQPGKKFKKLPAASF